MCRRAAVWCEGHGLPEMAVGYLQAAGDEDGTARLVSRLGQLPTYFGERISTLHRWIQWFEARGVERYPPIAVIGAFVMALVGQPATADRWMEAAERGAWDRRRAARAPRSTVASRCCERSCAETVPSRCGPMPRPR